MNTTPARSCPPWCEKQPGHAADKTEAAWHVATVLALDLPELPGSRDQSTHPLKVYVTQFVNVDGEAESPTIQIKLSDTGTFDDREDLTPAEAQLIANAMITAAQIINECCRQ